MPMRARTGRRCGVLTVTTKAVATIAVQRRDVTDHLADNPSPKAQLPEIVERAYARARLEAARETGLDRTTFPATCPWSFAQLTDDTFWSG